MRIFVYGSTVVGTYDEIGAARVLADPATVRELTKDEITETFGEYAAFAGPPNTTVDAEGNITFNFDKDGWLTERNTCVRMERNKRLAACDWTVLPDVPVSESWMVYRQALRDVPSQPGFPLDIEWPEEPT